MKKFFLSIGILLLVLIGLWTAKCVLQLPAEKSELPVQTVGTEAIAPEPEATEVSTEVTELPTGIPTEAPTEAPAEIPTEVVYVYDFTPEEEELLLKLGMAERGSIYCKECVALVMRTVLNRVEGPRFSSSIRGVIYAQDQFTPAMDGTLETAVPSQTCYDALEMVKQGWDESQGALYYEWCEGASWHSQNLNLLFQHCDTRFYN